MHIIYTCIIYTYTYERFTKKKRHCNLVREKVKAVVIIPRTHDMTHELHS